MVKFIDSHSHLTFSDFDNDRSEVIGRMREQDIGSIDVGTTLKTSKAAVGLANEHDFMWASIGIHPISANEATKGVSTTDGASPTEELRKLADNPKVVAIGECGLDYHHEPYDEKAQKDLFVQHLVLHTEIEKPLILHCRNAHQDVLEMLGEHKGELSGTVHFFTGTIEQARQYIDLGFYIGLDGPITFTNEYDNLIKELPMDRILIETDSPYAAPAPYRGKRNEPAYVVEIAKKIAKIKGMSVDEVAEQTTANTKKLFKI